MAMFPRETDSRYLGFLAQNQAMSIWARTFSVATLCCASQGPSSHPSGPRGGPSHMASLMQVYLAYQVSANDRRQRRLRSPEPHQIQPGPSLRRCNALGCERIAPWPFARVEGMGQLHGSYASGAQSGGVEGMPMGGRGTIPGTAGGDRGRRNAMHTMAW